MTKGIVIPFRPSPDRTTKPVAENSRQVLKELRADLRCIKKAIRILEGVARQADIKPRKRQIGV